MVHHCHTWVEHEGHRHITHSDGLKARASRKTVLATDQNIVTTPVLGAIKKTTNPNKLYSTVNVKLTYSNLDVLTAKFRKPCHVFSIAKPSDDLIIVSF